MNKSYYPRKVLLLVSFVAMMLGLHSCHTISDVPVAPANLSADVPARWAAMTLHIAKKTPGNSPTYASRGFGYIGLTMYESVVNGYPAYKSMAGQLSNLSTLPKVANGLKYNWELSANAGQAYILKNIYEQTSDANKASIDSLEKVILTEKSNGEASDVISRSVAYGQAVAQAIFEWSKTDGGYQGYKNTFTASYVLPTTPGTWAPPTFSQSSSQLPMHPYWGNNRNFVSANTTIPLPTPLTYSTSPSSVYYTQFMAVYTKNKTLTQEEKEIALFWGDDPSRTFTPPGHSYSLASIAVKTAKADLITAAQTFAAVGIGVADAFVNCWRCKYKFVVQRPTAFIRANVDPSYIQFWPEPPFPAFYSGHAVQSATAATVLTAIYGGNFKIIDTSHEGEGQDPLTLVYYKNRSFNSFWDTAVESAYSRFLGGIHSQYDNDTGLTQGKLIGNNVANLKWKN